MTSETAVPVSLAEIARIAGVGRAAVSNWRRRHDSFPERIGGTDASPQFSLAEVVRWLRENGKLKDAGTRELLWPRFEALGSRDATGAAIAEVARQMRGGPSHTAGAEPAGLPECTRELIAEAVRLGQREGEKEVFDFLLQRWLDAHVRQLSTTPAPLADLMARTALRIAGEQAEGTGPRGTGFGRAAGARPHSAAAGTDGPVAGHVLTVLDPACGTGRLLAAAVKAYNRGPLVLLGCDRDPTVAALAGARLGFLADRAFADGGRTIEAGIRQGDSLRADPYPDAAADVVLCNPPFNERDWGYAELAADTRWTLGLPPRTEPELAWVQHALARLRPGGAAAVLLPPAVASRKAGRRIRAGLLRSGLLRAVIALPPGSAQPHSVSLHLWVLRAPGGGPVPGADEILLVDGARHGRNGGKEPGPDWESLGRQVDSALEVLERPEADPPAGAAKVPVLDLLDDEVDLTPGRHVAPEPAAEGRRLHESWREFTSLLTELGESSKVLSGLELYGDDTGRHPTTTVGQLARAGALTLRGGQQPPEAAIATGEPEAGGVRLLTIADLLPTAAPRRWVAPGHAGVVVEEGDVVVAGVIRAFSAWVHQGPPVALGPQLYRIRVDPGTLDAYFLAGCLRAPSNGRQAGTHASSSSRVDVRRLFVLHLDLEEQRRYSEAFRHIAALEELLSRTGELGASLVRELSDRLVAGRLPPRGRAG